MIFKSTKQIALLIAGLTLLTCVACGPGLMIQTQTIQTAPADKALVTFVRPTRFGGRDEFVVWDSAELFGVVYGGQYVQKEVTPGEHTFIVHAQNWAYIKANVEAGKKYYVLLNVSVGFTHAVAIPVILSKTQSEYGQTHIDQWMSTLKPMTPNPDVAPRWVAKRQPQVDKAVENGKKPDAKFQILNPEDNWN
jgi:hypothetical protein